MIISSIIRKKIKGQVIVALLQPSLSFLLLSFVVHFDVIITLQNIHSVVVLGHFSLVQELPLVFVDNFLPIEIFVGCLGIPKFAQEIHALVVILA